MDLAGLLIVLLVGFALGTVLGLLGGGGGILAIPLLVHVLGQGVDEASTTSLIVVAIGAAAGLVPHALAGRVEWPVGLLFGALGIVGATLGGKAAIVADDRLQMAGLIALIFLAASGMLRNADDSKSTQMRHRIRVGPDGQPLPPESPAAADTPASQGGSVPESPPGPAGGTEPAVPNPPRHRWLRLILSATGVGLITGFFGVGGGFIAVPALIWGVGLPVKKATATGLVVIIINSATALAARGTDIVDWGVAAPLSALAIVGAVTGALLSRRLSDRLLKRLFGFLLLAVGFHEVWQLALLY